MENDIDYGSWTVPKSWNDVTLKQFQDIERYYSDKDRKFDIREVVHIFCNKSEDEINALPVEFLEKIMESLSFLQTKPEEKEPTNKIKIDGEEYVINVMEKMKTGEYVASDSVMKSDRYDYASILAILCRKNGEIYDSKFEAELYEKRKEMFENQPVINILPIMSFFLNLWFVLETHSQLYSKVADALNLIQQNIDSSDKIGAFRKYFLNWRVKRLRKSLKSSKNTSQIRFSSSHTLSKKGKWKKLKTLGRKQEGKQ